LTEEGEANEEATRQESCRGGVGGGGGYKAFAIRLNDRKLHRRNHAPQVKPLIGPYRRGSVVPGIAQRGDIALRDRGGAPLPAHPITGPTAVDGSTNLVGKD